MHFAAFLITSTTLHKTCRFFLLVNHDALGISNWLSKFRFDWWRKKKLRSDQLILQFANQKVHVILAVFARRFELRSDKRNAFNRSQNFSACSVRCMSHFERQMLYVRFSVAVSPALFSRAKVEFSFQTRTCFLFRFGQPVRLWHRYHSEKLLEPSAQIISGITFTCSFTAENRQMLPSATRFKFSFHSSDDSFFLFKSSFDCLKYYNFWLDNTFCANILF